MALHRLPRLRNYFATKGGDAVIRSIGISGRQFVKIYTTYTLYDAEEAERNNYSDRNRSDSFDSLFKVRPVWNCAMCSFQAARAPPRDLSLDEVRRYNEFLVLFILSKVYSTVLYENNAFYSGNAKVLWWILSTSSGHSSKA